jgi:hypothetical protein
MLALVLLCLSVAIMDRPASAADEPKLTITGAVAHPLTLTVADLAALPQTDIRVSYMTSHGAEDATYSGVSLWSLIEKAGLGAALTDRKSHTAHYLLISASDGYQVVLALGEIDPDLEGKPAVIALKRDSQQIDAKSSFRLALAGDKHGARNMHLVTQIELK